jgi:hypothetical protein
MSSGNPENFCWNDSDEMTTRWDTPGDADLTHLAHEVNHHNNSQLFISNDADDPSGGWVFFALCILF